MNWPWRQLSHGPWSGNTSCHGDIPALRRLFTNAAEWLREGRELTEVQQRQRSTLRYRKKQSIVRNLWLAIAGLGLLAAFLSFAILDDTP